jgi:hypothetical protein
MPVNKGTITSSSLMRRAAEALAKMPDTLDARDFHRVLCTVCETDDQARNLSDTLRVRGYVERKVALTPKFFEDAKRSGVVPA